LSNRRAIATPRLVCGRCGESSPIGIAAACPCGGGYETEYDWDGLAGWHPSSGPDRFADLLPLVSGSRRVALGEGDTPIVEADGALLKCEHLNPTGSYKDRIAAIGISVAVSAGSGGWIGTSSGNSGAAFAAYGARAGLTGTVYTMASIPEQKRAQIEVFGTPVRRVAGLGEDPDAESALFKAVAERARRDRLALAITARTYNPAAMDGVKVIAYELVEQLGRAPDTVYVPTGGGGLLASLWRGFADMHRLGLADSRPRMIACQPVGCAPIHQAVLRGADAITPIRNPHSAISGLQLVAPPDGPQALEAVRSSRGSSVAVTDDEAVAAQGYLAREHGVFVEPAAAVGFAAFRQQPGAGTNVVILTGSGLKTAVAASLRLPPADIDDIAGI
jgi:threonine synthase